MEKTAKPPLLLNRDPMSVPTLGVNQTE